MFRKILKKDFKRKKAMNIILFIFMLTASTLIASSSNLLYSTLTAIDYFIEISKVADLISLTTTDAAITEAVEEWQQKSSVVEEVIVEEAVMVDEEKVTASTGKDLRNTSSLVIMTQPKEHNLIFDTEGKKFEVGAEEAAIPVSIQKKMGLKIGDWISVEVNGYREDFTVKHIFKDVVFGAELMGLKRIILNEEDYSTYETHAKTEELLKLWGCTKAEGYTNKDLMNDFSDLILPTYTIMSKDIISTAYIMDMILAVIMIIVSIFLILISFLILRFTIVFTVMEDYKQIGVMKAIGLKNQSIRGMYSVKYLSLALVSGLLGYLIALPVSDLMKGNISQYILLKETAFNNIISLGSVIAVVGITILFCNYSTGKIKKVSAIDAIRQGSNGERFKNSKKLKLHQRKRMSIPFFLACSDIVSDFKKFIILIITFILGTSIIIIPNNIISTLSSDGTIKLFGYIDHDFYIRDGLIGNQEVARNRIEELSKQFEAAGIEAELSADLITNGKAFTADKTDSIGILGFQGLGTKAEEYEYFEGTVPVLLNEIAVTEKVAQYLGVGIGDTIICEIQGETKEYLITALFQTFNNLGNAVRLVEEYEGEKGGSTSIMISGNLSGSAEVKEQQLTELKDTFPELEIKSAEEVVDSFIGNVTSQVGAIKNLILIIVLGINFFITALLIRMLISKEVPEIAILKSLGFHSYSVRLWQAFRIGIILFISIIIGTLLANSTGNILAAGIFKIMGVTRLQLTIEAAQVYLIYPAILFAATMIAVLLNLGQVKKTHVWELNNQE